jgi:spermidine synthase
LRYGLAVGAGEAGAADLTVQKESRRLASTARRRTAAVAAMLLCSGAAGLMYQVAWVRLLGLTFGVTIFAVSTVLAAFMGGLAIGSLLGGTYADRASRPLVLYGLVELGVGLTAVCTPVSFAALQDVYAAVASAAPPAVAAGVRTVTAFGVLLLPTALMGASLPLAVRAARGVRPESDPTASDTWTMGLLYALNTAGAICGCLLSGFVLIGRFGLSETIQIAAAANCLAGLGALSLASRMPRHTRRAAQATSDTPPTRLAAAACWAFAASGAISLAYEVVWTRILAVLFDSSIYGFVLMLATVLLGIAVGGAVGGAVLRWRSTPRFAGLSFGWLEIGIGLSAVSALVVFGGAYQALSNLRESGSPLARLVRTDLRLMTMLCVLTVLPSALLMGGTFPVAARLWAAGAGGLARRLGGVYAANVAGAIVGSLASGFILLPLLGAHDSLLLLGALNVLLGSALLGVTGSRPVLAGAISLLVIGWGATRPPIHEVVFGQHFPDQHLVAYWEGLENTVSVGRAANGIQTLFTNSRGQTNDAPDLVRYHRVMGHLGALLAPERAPRTLVIGLGAGATPGAIARHASAQIDVIELSDAVIRAAPFFRVANADVLEQPNVRLSVDDGRNYLLRNRQPYDVITADVVHPFDAGATNLYSYEYFSLVAHALQPRGIMVQWVSPGTAFEHSLIVRTFLRAFPNATLWLGGDLLIGSPSPLHVDRAELEARLADPSARAALAEVGFNHAQDVLAQYRASSGELAAYAGDGPILTDDHPLLEYFESQDIPPDPPDFSQFHAQPPLE